jgi:CubicO group peptidase (beta-lactamase class C family)
MSAAPYDERLRLPDRVRRMNTMKWMILAVLIFLLTSICLAAEKSDAPRPAQSTDELRQQLEKILKDAHTNGASVAIVHKDRPEWVTGLGIADMASGRAATSDTLFRIGSTSKAFTSLSILMLADQGKLTLDDPVHKLVPDVWFENRWEASDPIRIVNVLEHTTGWDDLHLREYAKQAPDNMSVREGLDYDHHSRTSRWRPGTRMSYCNSGPPVAAYIVEKLTGQKFEDFVQQNLFLPIGMKTATYFEPAPGRATTLYHDDGKTPYQYGHILMRPAGSINASANDMAAYLQFYLNRGAVGGKQIVPASDIDRMEIPTSTWAAKDGMKAGYGLSNFWSVHDGFVYHGHDGGVEGGITDMSYMPDYGVGYFYSINSENGDAFDKIGNAIRAYITSNLPKPPVPAVAPLPPNATDYAGWYEPNSPRTEITHFIFTTHRAYLDSVQRREITFQQYGFMERHLFPGDGQAVPPYSEKRVARPDSKPRVVDSEPGRALHPEWFRGEGTKTNSHLVCDFRDIADCLRGSLDAVDRSLRTALDFRGADKTTSSPR